MQPPLNVYAYASCDTCRRALKWLREAGVEHTVLPIREQPPTVAELRRALAAVGGERRKLFNTAGRDYRAMGLKDQLAAMSDEEALKLLASHGNLVKRPLAVARDGVLVGFRAEAWSQELGSSERRPGPRRSAG